MLPLTVALAGCRLGAETVVTRTADGVLWVGVRPLTSGYTPCIDIATIRPGRLTAEAPPAWQAGRTNLGRCVQMIRVGQATPGFEQRTTTALRPARLYCVTVSGPGFSDTRPFTLGEQGTPSIGQQGPDDGC